MPILTVIAGPNGSGKSTLTTLLTNQGIAFGEYLNADDIAGELSGSPEWVSQQAQQIVRDRRDLALHEGRDHAFETVMSHTSHIEYMTRAAESGFEVRLFFVGTENPVINLDRVSNRVLRGGHPVPSDRIVARYQRCLDNLPAAIAAADHVEIFDNSTIDQPLAWIASIARMPSGDFDFTWHKIGKSPVWWLEIVLKLRARP